MPIENASYPSQLDPDVYGPTGPDAAGEGDNHILQNKYVLKNTFSALSGPVTANQNDLNITAGAAAAGVTAADIQQLVGIGSDSTIEERLAAIETSGADGSAAWGGITGTLANQTDLQVALNLKADLDSPELTGTPTAPTPEAGDASTKIATTAFVSNQVSAASGIGLLDSWHDLDDGLNILTAILPSDAKAIFVWLSVGCEYDSWTYDDYSYTPESISIAPTSSSSKMFTLSAAGNNQACSRVKTMVLVELSSLRVWTSIPPTGSATVIGYIT